MFLIGLVVMLLVSVAPVIMLTSGDGGAVLFLDMNMTGDSSLVDPSLVPGEVFFVILYVDDVENMWGYQLKLGYNTSVLTATDFAGTKLFLEVVIWFPLEH